jgi:hypothetical protein
MRELLEDDTTIRRACTGVYMMVAKTSIGAVDSRTQDLGVSEMVPEWF